MHFFLSLVAITSLLSTVSAVPLPLPIADSSRSTDLDAGMNLYARGQTSPSIRYPPNFPVGGGLRNEVRRLTKEKYKTIPDEDLVKTTKKNNSVHVKLLDNGWVNSEDGRQFMKMRYHEGHHRKPGRAISEVMRLYRGVQVEFGPGIRQEDEEDLRVAVHSMLRSSRMNPILKGATKATVYQNFAVPEFGGLRRTMAVLDFPEGHPAVDLHDRTVTIADRAMSEAARARRAHMDHTLGVLSQNPGELSRPSKRPRSRNNDHEPNLDLSIGLSSTPSAPTRQNAGESSRPSKRPVS